MEHKNAQTQKKAFFLRTHWKSVDCRNGVLVFLFGNTECSLGTTFHFFFFFSECKIKHFIIRGFGLGIFFEDFLACAQIQASRNGMLSVTKLSLF